MSSANGSVGTMVKMYYDNIANDYERMIKSEDERNQFPYDGYNHILRTVAEEMMTVASDNDSIKLILDAGIGTGYLYEFYPTNQCEITGIDLSPKMLDLARERVPEGNFLEADINDGFPDCITDKQYDVIVSTYMCEHINHTHLMRFMERALALLKPFGKLLIAGPIFYDFTTKKSFQRKHYKEPGLSLYFHVYESIVSDAPNHLSFSFMQIKPHAGVIMVQKSYEYALQMEESLIEYNRNTMKWKSSQSRKKENGRKVKAHQND